MKRILPALLAGLAAAATATAAATAAEPAVPTLRVTGEAQVSAKPDRAQIDVGVITRAATSQEAAERNAAQAEAVIAAVRKTAREAQLRTANYALSPTYQNRPNAEPLVTGYVATNLVQVTLDDLTRLGPVIDAAQQAGANRIQGIGFTLRDQDAVRAEALRQAAARARAEADVLAAALGLRVVRVISADVSSPRLMPMRAYASARMAEAAATPVESGTLDVSATVSLVVEVAPVAH